MKKALLFLFIIFSPSAWAEGAHRYFDCHVTLLCDAAGHCEPASESLTFHLAPLDADEAGSGTFLLTYQEQETQMQSLSDAGPYVWQIDNVRHTLLASSESAFLWHQLNLNGTPDSTIRYLQCSLRY